MPKDTAQDGLHIGLTSRILAMEEEARANRHKVQRVDALDVERARLDTECARLRRERDAIRDERNEFMQETRRLREENVGLKTRLDETDAALTDRLIAETGRLTEQFTTEVRKSREEATNWQKKYVESQSRLDEAKTALSDKLRETSVDRQLLPLERPRKAAPKLIIYSESNAEAELSGVDKTSLLSSPKRPTAKRKRGVRHLPNVPETRHSASKPQQHVKHVIECVEIPAFNKAIADTYLQLGRKRLRDGRMTPNEGASAEKKRRISPSNSIVLSSPASDSTAQLPVSNADALLAEGREAPPNAVASSSKASLDLFDGPLSDLSSDEDTEDGAESEEEGDYNLTAAGRKISITHQGPPKKKPGPKPKNSTAMAPKKDKGKKKEESSLVSALNGLFDESLKDEAKASIAELLGSIPSFPVTPSPAPPPVPREFLVSMYGGAPGTTIMTMHKILGRHAAAFFQPTHNPHAPRTPGAPGLIFTGRSSSLCATGMVRMFAPAPTKQRRWTYLGEYKLDHVRPLTGAEMQMYPRAVNGFAEQALKTQWREYRGIRAKVYLRKYGRPTTSADVERELARMPPHYDPARLSEDDIKRAFLREEVALHVVATRCVGYDELFARDVIGRYHPPAAI